MEFPGWVFERMQTKETQTRVIETKGLQNHDCYNGLRPF